MLMLLFYVENERYAIQTNSVVEIVPLVALKKLQSAPETGVQVFNYRNQIVPVIDLCQLIHGYPCRPLLSTRIILVNQQDKNEVLHLFGLLAERVTETIDKKEADFFDPKMTGDLAPYLEKIITDKQGMIQCVRLDYLLPSSQTVNLLPESQAKK